MLEIIKSFIFKYFHLDISLLKGILFSIYSFFNKGLNFILLILIAKYLSPTQYGSLSIFTTFLTLVSIIMCLSSEGYVSICYFKESEYKFKQSIGVLLITPIVLFIIFISIAFFYSLFKSSVLGLNIYEITYALIISLSNIYIYICLEYFRVKDYFRGYGIISCSYALFNFIITIILIINFQYGWLSRVYAQLITSIVYALIAIMVFFKLSLIDIKAIANVNILLIKRIYLWGIPLIPHAASNWIRQGCDRYFIDSFYNTYDVGIFSFALNLISIIIIIGLAFNSSNSIEIFKMLKSSIENSIIKIRLYNKKMIVMYVVILLFLLLIVPLFVHIFVPKYIESIVYFYILVPYGFLQCLYYLYCNFLFYYEKNKEIMKITFISSIIHLVLSFILTRYSLCFTALIYTLSQIFVYFILRYKVAILLKNLYSDYKPNFYL